MYQDLNVKPEIPKLQGENKGSSAHDTGVRKEFVNRAPFAQELRATDKCNTVN